MYPLFAPAPDVHMVIASFIRPAESSIAICLTRVRILGTTPSHSVCYLLPSQSWWCCWVGGGCLNEEFWKREMSDRRVDNRKKENKATVTDRWETGGGDLNIIIHCRSDGSQKIKIEMPNLICVTFTVTLPCVSLSECHFPSMSDITTITFFTHRHILPDHISVFNGEKKKRVIHALKLKNSSFRIVNLYST